MRKILVLYMNEMIKVIKKVSVIIILSIMIVAVICTGALMKTQDYISKQNSTQYNNSDDAKKQMQEELSTEQKRIKKIDELLPKTKPEDIPALLEEKVSSSLRIDIIKIAIEKKIELNSPDYRAKSLNKIYELKIQMRLSINTRKQTADIIGLIQGYENVVNQNDLKSFIALENDQINSDKSVTADEKKISIESNELRLKLNITGQPQKGSYSDSSEVAISRIETEKKSLLYNLDLSGSQLPLTPEARENVKNDLAVNTYKLEHGISEIGNGLESSGIGEKLAYNSMLGIGLFMIVLLLMILAGASVSNEISSGSIKSLIISPAKRWKIFLAKFLAIISIGVIAGLILYIVTSLIYGAFFGFSSGSNYIFAVNGVAYELNFYIYKLAYLAASFLVVLVFATFAFMLSILTRNTAVSVSISMGIYFAGNVANTVLMNFVKGEWLKFSPFNHFNVAEKMFPNDALNQLATSGNFGAPKTSLAFSLIYIGVLMVCMLYTGLDSFNRRDIK